MNLDGLRRHVVTVHEGKNVTVLDVIKYEAHVEGGVHADEPRDQAARTLRSVNERLIVFGYRPTLRQLQSIGRVVIRGLYKLRSLVAEQQENA